MSEIYRSPIIRTAVALAATVGLTACSQIDAFRNDSADAVPALERCFDEPLPERSVGYGSDDVAPSVPEVNEDFQTNYEIYKTAMDSWMSREALRKLVNDPPELSLKLDGDRESGDPVSSPIVEERAVESIVKISTEEVSGTGFITTNAQGEQVVVTAAHVVAVSDLDVVKVENDKGNKRTVIDGCYIFESDNKFTPLISNVETPAQDSDIAVLRLKKPYAIPGLSIANSDAHRGQWVFFDNYQEGSDIGFHASYTGLVVSEPGYFLGQKVLTNLIVYPEQPTVGQIMANTMGPGASGGPVIDEAGNVIGISTSSLKEEYYLGNGDLEMYNVLMPGVHLGKKSGIWPSDGTIMPRSLIAQVLASDRA